MPLHEAPMLVFQPCGTTQSLSSLGFYASRSHSQLHCCLGLCTWHLFSQLLHSLRLCASRSHLARILLALLSCVSHSQQLKKRVSQSTQNSLKCIEMPKKIYPFDSLRALSIAQSLSDKEQPYLPHFTPRVPKSVHAKFYANWTKTVGARGIQTNKQTFLF